MSSIEVSVGDASVKVHSMVDTTTAAGTVTHYRVGDLIAVTTAALLAINTPEAIRLANAMPELTPST